MPETLRTVELCLAAVGQNGGALEYVPETLRTAELCLAAAMSLKEGWFDWEDCKDVPKELWNSAEFCLAAVQKDSWAIKYVPKNVETEEIFHAAHEQVLLEIKQGQLLIKEIPAKLRTPEACLASYLEQPYLGDIPLNKRNAAIYLAALTTHSAFSIEFREVPEKFLTAELCLAAVRIDGKALGYVPETLRTAELCAIAVRHKKWALEDVPETLRTAELCRTAVGNNGKALEYVPETLRTAELCAIAVRQNGEALQYVPETLRTAELSAIAVEQDSGMVRRIGRRGRHGS